MGTPEILLLTAAVPAALNWIGVARGSRRLVWVFKPVTVLVLIGSATAFRSEAHEGQWALTLAALVFSLAGDVLLMLPGERLVAGLGCFLVAHLCYIAGFTAIGAPADAVVPVFPGLAAPAAGLFVRFRRALLESGRRKLVVPVGAYVVVISIMVVTAFDVIGEEGVGAAAQTGAAVGAALFYVSDALNGWRRFVRQARWMPVAVMVTYHLGQAGLVLALRR